VAGNLEGNLNRQGVNFDGAGNLDRAGFAISPRWQPPIAPAADLSRKIHRRTCAGEILQLKETLNTMVDQLNRFAGEVTRVGARGSAQPKAV